MPCTGAAGPGVLAMEQQPRRPGDVCRYPDYAALSGGCIRLSSSDTCYERPIDTRRRIRSCPLTASRHTRYADYTGQSVLPRTRCPTAIPVSLRCRPDILLATTPIRYTGCHRRGRSPHRPHRFGLPSLGRRPHRITIRCTGAAVASFFDFLHVVRRRPVIGTVIRLNRTQTQSCID